MLGPKALSADYSLLRPSITSDSMHNPLSKLTRSTSPRPLHSGSWMATALLFLMLAATVTACGSTDANDNDDDPDDPPGTSPAPSLAVSPGALDYGEVDTEASQDAVITIANNGDAALEGRIEVESGSSYFTTPDTGSYEIGAESSLEVTVTFAPSAEADLEGRLSITHNAENTSSPAVVSLTGTGIVEIADPPARP